MFFDLVEDTKPKNGRFEHANVTACDLVITSIIYPLLPSSV